ncbi:MAG: 3-keto-disaccharide hydrolase [Bacteroidota bacterium]
MKISNVVKLFFAVIPLTLTVSCNSGEEDRWVDLFNGENLEGWVQKGGEAEYVVEEGVIIGKTVLNTPNSFLCTKEMYGDFILEFELKGDPKLNSGVQFRSHSDPDYMNGRVHGYQCEVDPSDRAWSGGIYDEARRGWLYPLTFNPPAKEAYRVGDWNKFRIEAIGDTIRTFVNGIPVANLLDEWTGSGFIGLQVHSVSDDPANEGLEVRWRNIRIITENPSDYRLQTNAPEVSRLVNKLSETEINQGWELLFDGENVENWRGAHQENFPEVGWKIENGELIVVESGGAESQHGGDIVTRNEYAKFELHLEFKITEGANSGIKYYVTEKEETAGSAIGLEYQILDDERHPDAKLGAQEGSRTLASLYDLIKAENKRFTGIGKWNWAIVKSDGVHVEHWLNGIKVLEYERGSEEFRQLVKESKYANWENFGEAEEGHILLQDHGDRVSFRSIKVLPVE